MIDYIGLLLTGLGTIIFGFKDPWDKKFLKSRLTLGRLGVLLLIAGIIITGMSTYYSNLEKTGYRNQLNTINNTVQQTLTSTNQGFENILHENEVKTTLLLTNFKNNYNKLIATIISQSDTALNSQLHKIRKDYQILSADYLTEKDIAHRYYFAEQWPFSDKNKDISNAMFFFIPVKLSGLLTGTDMYIIWYLITNNGSFSYNQIDKLNNEIWTKLKPMSLSINKNLERLQLLEVIKPNFWDGNVEFTDYFMKRLKVYQEYKNTDMKTDAYVKKLFELEIENK